MTALDIIVFFALGFGAVFGFMRGFVHEILSLIAWVMVIFAVRFLHAPVVEYLTAPVGSQSGAAVLAFLLVGIITYMLGRWLARELGKRTRQSILGPVDRVLGFGFGAVKGLIGSTLLFLLAVLVFDTIYGVDRGRPDWIARARTYALMNASGDAMSEFVRARQEALAEAEPAGTGAAK